MPCIAPPELTAMDLLAYFDRSDPTCGRLDSPHRLHGGENPGGSRDVAAHLAECPHCRERAARLHAEEQRARRLLSRAACPTSDELGEYQLRIVEPARASEIAGHVAGCARCQRELDTLAEFLSALAPDLALTPMERVRDAVASGVRVVVAQLLGSGGMSPAYAMRGSQPAPLIFAAEDKQVIVEAQAVAGRSGLYSVLGIATGLIEATDYTAHLWRDDLPVNSIPLDPLGNFTFSHLDRGSYDVLITGPDLEIHVPAVPVGDPRESAPT